MSATTPAITVIPVETPALGDRSYLVHDGVVAFAVDPQRDIDRVLVPRPAPFADLAQVRHHRDVIVLDVRRSDEFAAGRIQGALNIPIHELPARLADVPAGEVWVHCAGGYRASVAASFLAAADRRSVAVDDSFDDAGAAGLPIVGREAL